MPAINLDPKKLLGFKIIAKGESSGTLRSPKIGGKGCPIDRFAMQSGRPCPPRQDRHRRWTERFPRRASDPAMIDGFRFAPDAAHAARCDRAMHAGLADSLRQICEASDGKVEFDRAAIERLIERDRSRPPPAAAMPLRSITNWCRPCWKAGSMRRARCSRSLRRQRPIEAPFRMLALGEPAMAGPGRALSALHERRYRLRPTCSCRLRRRTWRPSSASSPVSWTCCSRPRPSSSQS